MNSTRRAFERQRNPINMLVVLAFVVYGAWLYFDHSPTYEGLETEVLREPFDNGSAMVYSWTGDVIRNCKGTLRRQVRQGTRVFYISERSFSQIPSADWDGRSEQDFVVTVSIAGSRGILTAGPASYHVTSRAYCNKIQELFGNPVEEVYPPVHFIIHINDLE